jgi:hypothetical protein
MTAHATHTMHENSTEAFAALPSAERCRLVLTAYEDRGPLTDKQVCAILGLAMANVQPRISDMMHGTDTVAKCLIEDGKTRDQITGRRVRMTRRIAP